MKTSEVMQLLTFMAMFDHRTVSEFDAEAWSMLDVCKRYDLETCRLAVVKFFDQPPTERGESRYLDPHQLKAMVKQVRREQARESNKRRAQALATLSQKMADAGHGYAEIEARRQELLGAEEAMLDKGASYAEVEALRQRIVSAFTVNGPHRLAEAIANAPSEAERRRLTDGRA